MTLKSTGVTYRLMAISSFLNLDYIPMNIGNDGVGVHGSYVCVYYKLSLGINGQ